jgi:hypothetical protein
MNDMGKLSPKEICERGQKLLDERLSGEDLERRHGQMAAVDILTGEIGFGQTAMDAKKALLKAVPQPVTYVGRVGFRAAAHFGGSSVRFKR